MVLPLSSGVIGCNHLVQTPLFVRPVGKEISRSDAMFFYVQLRAFSAEFLSVRRTFYVALYLR